MAAFDCHLMFAAKQIPEPPADCVLGYASSHTPCTMNNPSSFGEITSLRRWIFIIIFLSCFFSWRCLYVCSQAHKETSQSPFSPIAHGCHSGCCSYVHSKNRHTHTIMCKQILLLLSFRINMSSFFIKQKFMRRLLFHL